MGKIYEIDFTANSAYWFNSIGTVVSGAYGTGIQHQSPLPGFSVRPGKYFNSSTAITGFPDPTTIYEPTRLRKSIVFWMYTTGESQTNNGAFYFDQHYNNNDCHGWRYSSGNGALNFYINQANRGMVTPSGVINTPRWHMLTATIDRSTTYTKVYYNKTLYGNFNLVPTVASYMRINEDRNGNKGKFITGLISIYDHILSQSEIDNIYDTYLPDALIQTPIATLSGVVLGIDEVPISGAQVAVFNHTNNQLESTVTTDADGRYVAYFSTIGTYTLFSSKPPNKVGGRAIPITVTSGGIITFYDS